MIDFEPIVTKHLLDDPAIQSMTNGRVFAGDFLSNLKRNSRISWLLKWIM